MGASPSWSEFFGHHLIPSLVTGLIIWVILSALLHRTVTEPLRHLFAHLYRVGSGRLEPISPDTGVVEIQTIVEGVNLLVHRLRATPLELPGPYPGAGSPQKNTKQNSVDGRCRRTRQPDLSRPRQGIESTGGRCPSAGVIRRKIRGGCRTASLGQNPLHCRLVILRLSFKEEFLDQRSWCYFEYTDDERVLENMAFSVSFDASLRSPPLPEESGSPDRKRVG